ncbi:MAG: ABC transporter substrate-binding protein [Alphaproteobacteria bacterium]|nr:ABC transporter substrate-binding protein [Alphaproteobacteria bacterium]
MMTTSTPSCDDPLPAVHKPSRRTPSGVRQDTNSMAATVGGARRPCQPPSRIDSRGRPGDTRDRSGSRGKPNMSNRHTWIVGRTGALVAALFAVAAQAQQADTLRVGNWDFPGGRGNPFSTVPGIPQVYIWSAIFDTATYVDEKGRPSAGLATAWKNVSPTTWQLTMRGAKFQNGEPVNAEAVVKTIEWFGSERGKASVGGQTFNYVTGARAIDAQTVELTTANPRPIFPNQLAALYVVPPKAWADLGIEQFTAKPVGSGPYRVVDWAGEAIRTEAFADSWRQPKIVKIEYTRLPEQIARRQALVSNQIDIMLQATPDDIAPIKAAGGTVDIVPSPLLLQLAFVLENAKEGLDIAPLKDRRVRQALNYAVDKEAINKNLLGGIMGINSQYSLPIAFGYNSDLKPYPYDPDRAKALLAEAGYPRGFKIVAEIRDYFDVFRQVAQDLGKVGVNVEMSQVVAADWSRKFLQVKWDGHAFSVPLGVAPELDTIRMMLFQSCRKNPAYYCNRDVMPLVDAADSEFDPAKREKILHNLMARLREDAPALFLFEQQDLNAYGKRVRGFKNVNRVLNYHEMTLEN